MRSIAILLSLLCVSCAQAADDSWMYGYRAKDNKYYDQVMRTTVHARSPYRNPYFRPNSSYEPQPIGEPEWIINDKLDGKMSKPPKGLLEILTKGTYTIVESK